ncbi:MAG: tRNA pseudouridine(38-40) synthase TruA [Bacteroidales bacterium]|jgi:tRNA pseudouridine38-40 synthase
MARFRLIIEYDGTKYAGWQLQKGGRSVQGEILDACRELFGDAKIDLYGAGRTDSGVHAIGQTAHLDVQTELTPLKVRYGINDRLPADICIISVDEADQRFHARHDAIARSYIYQISRRRTALGKKYVWWIKDELDSDLMNDVATLFEGLKDFRSFTDPDLESSSTRTEILYSRVTVHKNIILFHVIGTHFLWKQVRRMTGVLVEAGRGKLSKKDIAGFLRSQSDIPAKLTAPPSGLFLEKVYYKGDKIVYDAKAVMNI